MRSAAHGAGHETILGHRWTAGRGSAATGALGSLFKNVSLWQSVLLMCIYIVLNFLCTSHLEICPTIEVQLDITHSLWIWPNYHWKSGICNYTNTGDVREFLTYILSFGETAPLCIFIIQRKTYIVQLYIHCNKCCEAQGKGRARGGPRKVTEWSFIDGGWWMVDILSLMLYIKFGCHHPPPPPPPPIRTFNFT